MCNQSNSPQAVYAELERERINKTLERLDVLYSMLPDGQWVGTEGYGGSVLWENPDDKTIKYKVCDIRGWGHLQYLGETKAIAIQEATEAFIVELHNAYPAMRDEIKWLQATLSAKEAEIERLRKEAAFRPLMPAEEKQCHAKTKYSNGSVGI